MNQSPRKPEAEDDEPARTGVDASNPRQVEERTKRSGQREQRRLNGLKQVLKEPDSRLWLWDLLSFCGINRTSFTGNSTTFFNEGQRNVGLKIQAELSKHHPDQLVSMMKEGEQNA